MHDIDKNVQKAGDRGQSCRVLLSLSVPHKPSHANPGKNFRNRPEGNYSFFEVGHALGDDFGDTYEDEKNHRDNDEGKVP